MDNGSKLSPEQQAIILETAKREREIAALPNPAKWETWKRRNLDELREFGPRYRPGEWFGDGFPLPEKHRVRFLRALHELGHMGLIDRFTGEGGRVENVKLTPAGAKMAAELTKPTKRAKAKPVKAKKTIVAPVPAAPIPDLDTTPPEAAP